LEKASKWEKELKEKEAEVKKEKAKEKPKKKKPERKVEEPEGVPEEGLIKEKPKKKIPSPDKQINQKRKEIEEIERKYIIFITVRLFKIYLAYTIKKNIRV